MSIVKLPDPYARFTPSELPQKWDVRFMHLAATHASWSKDPSTKVGAIIARGNRPISHGYNGFPARLSDKPEWLNDRNVKYPLTLHAEHNAVLSSREITIGATCYVWPIPPCASCASILIQEGVDIARVVSLLPTPEQRSRWGPQFELAFAVFDEAQVDLELYPVETFQNSEFWPKIV